MAQTHTHTGSHHSIPPTASPGLRFLASFLPAVDGSDPSALSPFLAPGAVFVINGAEATPAETIVAMMEMRARRLKTFRHELKRAWDVDCGGGKRTVLYESVSVTVFRDDRDEKAVEVVEFSTVELEAVEGGVEGLGLRATVLKTFMDTNPIMLRLKQIGGSV
jgi:hypothetical protein